MAKLTKRNHPPFCFFAFINLVQALHGLRIEYDANVAASPGENVTLKCILSGHANTSVVQIQWAKETNTGSQIMLIANKHFGIHRYLDSLDFESRSPTDGTANISVVNVQVSASGTYTCSVVTFPDGSFKASIVLTVAKKVQPTTPQIYKELTYVTSNKLQLNSTCISQKANQEPHITLYLDGNALQEEENVTIITSEVSVDSSGLYEVKKIFSIEITIGQWKLMWCEAEFSQPGNKITVMQSKKIHLNDYLSPAFTKLNTFNSQPTTVRKDLFTAFTKLNTFNSQPTTVRKGTESNSSTELTTSTGLPLATGSSTLTTESTSFISFTSAGLNATPQVSQSSTTSGPSVNIASSSIPETSFTNEPLTMEGQTITLRPFISFGSSQVSVKSTEMPMNVTTLVTTMSWNRTITIEITRDAKGAEDSVSLATVVSVILILVFCTAVLSCLIRCWQVRKKLNAPPPFKPPPPPIKYTAIQVEPQNEVN
ncbi:T-cell surface protein tactile [Rhinoraja longicauda]